MSENAIGSPVKLQAKWIKADGKPKDVCPLFVKTFSAEKMVKSAVLRITALTVITLSTLCARISIRTRRLMLSICSALIRD